MFNQEEENTLVGAKSTTFCEKKYINDIEKRLCIYLLCYSYLFYFAE